MKNLLQVNSNKESLSNKASYANLRHCALSQLFKYEADGKIPNYAWRNFSTQFTYYQAVSSSAHNKTTVKELYIRNGEELTQVLEAASTNQLLDDNDNVIMDIRCDFINHFQFNDGENLRREATAAADNVVKTLQEWIKKASIFVSNRANQLAAHDYVVVPDDNIRGSKSNNKHHDDAHKCHNKDDHDYTPMEWAARFIQILLSPEEEKGRSKNDLSSWTTVPKHNSSNSNHHTAMTSDIHLMMDQYEDTIESIADTVVTGFNRASKFFIAVAKDFDEMAQKNKNKKNQNNEDVLSLSSSPSLSESSSSYSSTEDNEEDVVKGEEGVEIIFGKKDGNSEEWKIFFGDDEGSNDGNEKGDNQAEDDGAVLINHICNSDVVSMSSSASSGKDDDDMSSFADVSNSGSDNESWAMFSDDEE